MLTLMQHDGFMERTNLHKGRLIVFEGIDGTGKSTQVEMLSQKLQAAGYNVVSTREPTDGIYGQRIRALYVNRESVSKEEELELFLSDRREHVENLIAPALTEGKIVLTDRYYLSTAAYQGAAGDDFEKIMQMNEEFAPVPDLVIMLELSAAESVRRIQTYRKDALNDFEQEEGLQQVAKVFEKINRPYIKRIDATKKIAEVHNMIMVEINKLTSQIP